MKTQFTPRPANRWIAVWILVPLTLSVLAMLAFGMSRYFQISYMHAVVEILFVLVAIFAITVSLRPRSNR